MESCAVRSFRLVPAGRSILFAATLACILPAAVSATGLSGSPDLSAVIPEFNRICSDLVRARAELGAGLLEEAGFEERILTLFIAADSLQVTLFPTDGASRRPGTHLFAMERGLRYLIDSLRENYIGAVARNGVRFIAADQALQAAVAWRSGAGVAPAGTMEAARP